MIATETGRSASLISVLQRASRSNLVMVEFPAPPPGGDPVTNIDRRPDPNGYNSLLVFRYGAGVWTQNVEPEIVSVSAKLVGGRLILDNPIDSSACGSPMISENGVVGILQEEKSGILFTTAADTLKWADVDRKATP